MNVVFPPETERKLRQLAQQRGLDPAEMVREWVERELTDWVVDPSRPLVDPEGPSAG